MQTFEEYRPTQFDCRGLGSDGQEDWLVLPVIQTRDSGPIDQSNFAAALEQLGGESETVEVHRFGHWGPGWFEIIVVNPEDKARLAIAEDIEKNLEEYPLLDEEDFSRRESEMEQESWEDWGYRDFADALGKAFELSDVAKDALTNLDCNRLWEFFQDKDGYSECSDTDVHFDFRRVLRDTTREEIAGLIREGRKAA